MKKNIAIVAGGDSSEIVISLKSADGIYSFIDKDKYNLYIAIVKRDEWAVILPSGEHTPIDKNDFSFKENGVTRHFDFAYITIHGTPNTAHSLNPVPCVYVTENKAAKVEDGRLADVAPTILKIMGLEAPAEMNGNVLIK